MLRSEQRIQHNKSNYFSMGAADDFFAPMAISFRAMWSRHTPAFLAMSEIPAFFLYSSVTLKHGIIKLKEIQGVCL